MTTEKKHMTTRDIILAGILLAYWHLSKMLKAPGAPMASMCMPATWVQTRCSSTATTVPVRTTR